MKDEILCKLKDHQRAPAVHLHRLITSGINSADISDGGTGKTYVTAAVVAQLQVPTLVVAPKISVPAWHRAAALFEDKVTVIPYEALRMGRSGAGQWENNPPPGFKSERYFKCQVCQRVVDFENFERCWAHPAGIHCVEEKKKAWKYGKFIYNPGASLVVFDEAHRCNGNDSLNQDMVVATRRQGIPSICLSATLADSPLKMNGLGYVLGLHNGANFYGWSRKYGCGQITGMRGWHWLLGKEKQKEAMSRLHAEIIPSRGVRMRTADIPNFPERTVTADLFDVTGSEVINGLYAEMREAMERHEKREAMDLCAENPLTKLLRLRERLELLKVPLAVELVKEHLAKGYSVGVFVNFTSTMRELRARLGCNTFIDGSPEGQRTREASIQKFCDDKERTILVNAEAGGVSVSLQDTRGEFPRVGLVMPVLSAVTFSQICWRFHRVGAKTPCFYKLLLAQNTDEEKIYQKLLNRLGNLEALNDGDFLP